MKVFIVATLLAASTMWGQAKPEAKEPVTAQPIVQELPVTKRVYSCAPDWKLQTWQVDESWNGSMITSWPPPPIPMRYEDQPKGLLVNINDEDTDWHGHPPRCAQEEKKPESVAPWQSPRQPHRQQIILDNNTRDRQIGTLQREKAELLRTIERLNEKLAIRVSGKYNDGTALSFATNDPLLAIIHQSFTDCEDGKKSIEWKSGSSRLNVTCIDARPIFQDSWSALPLHKTTPQKSHAVATKRGGK